MRIVAKGGVAPVHGTVIFILQENSRQAPRKFAGDLPECQVLTGADGAFHFEVVPQIVMKLLE